MKSMGLLVSLLVILSSVAAFSGTTHAQALQTKLEFKNGDLIANLSIDPDDRKGNQDFMDIEWTNREGQSVDPGGTVTVELWMNMDGRKHHSAPTFVQRLNSSHDHVANMYFIMSGAWEITITLKSFLWFEETQVWPVTLDSSMAVCESLP